jgi:hypothetical protein
MTTATINGLKIEISEDCDGDWTGTLTEISSGHRYDCRFDAGRGAADRLLAALTASALAITSR